MNRRWITRKARWALPAGVVVLTGAVVAGTMAASAAAAPKLPHRSAAGLLASMQRATLPEAFTATVTQSADLGIPNLPDVGGISSPVSVLTGSHTVNLWYAGPAQVRVELPVSFGERDLRVNGSQVWLWDSKTQTATHLVLPRASGRPGMLPAGAGGPTSPEPAAGSPGLALTPVQAARRLLAAVGPTTAVSVQGTTTVAGRAAYQLVIVPRSPQSLIGQVRIAVDAALGLPLQLQVYPRGSSRPAFQAGFTALQLGPPAAANFRFIPPPGATVRTRSLPGPGGSWVGAAPLVSPVPAGPGPVPRLAPGAQGGSMERIKNLGTNGGGFFVVRPVCARHVLKSWIFVQRPRHLPPGLRLQRRLHVPCMVFPLHRAVAWPLAPAGSGPIAGLPGPFGGSGIRVLGSGWLSVLVLPGGASAAGSGSATYGSGSATYGSGSAAYSSTLRVRADPGQLGGLLAVLLRAAVPVHGAWGSGRLLRTPLLSVLITSKGPVLAGAVSPAVLYADAAKVK